jgi:hypothetical protein
MLTTEPETMKTTPNAGLPGNPAGLADLVDLATATTTTPTPAELAEIKAELSAVLARHGRARVLRWAVDTIRNLDTAADGWRLATAVCVLHDATKEANQ